MEQTLIVKLEDYYTEHEDKSSEVKLELKYHKTTFSEYGGFRKYLHINVGEYNNLNIYLELPSYKAEKIFLDLANQAKELHGR